MTFLTAALKQEFQASHRDCYQILLLNFRSSTETVSQEDSQIYFAKETFFALGGGGGSKQRFSNLGSNQFFKRRNLTENSCQYRRILEVTFEHVK